MAIGVTTVRPSRAAIRVRRSAAARREKVSTKMVSGVAPALLDAGDHDSTRVVVFPVPGRRAPAAGPPGWSTTACWAASSAARRRRTPGQGVGERTRRYMR
jgi:hypothetical protein